MTKLLQTIRFDVSDTHVFEQAAEPGEFAVPGGFWFSQFDRNDIEGKRKQAFANGFLSLETFGFSTLTSIVEVSEDKIADVVCLLARRLISDFGAPDKASAKEVAGQELSFVLELCEDVPVNSIFALSREFDAKSEIREQFRIIEPPKEQVHARVWEVIE